MHLQSAAGFETYAQVLVYNYKFRTSTTWGRFWWHYLAHAQEN